MNTNCCISLDLLRKLEKLEQTVAGYDTVAIGFSGGVDSTFLAAVCARCIPENTLLIHLDTPFTGTPEQDSFDREIVKLGLPVISLKIDTLADPVIASNPQNRCYHCKHMLFSHLCAEAEKHGCVAVLEGSNADDAGDFRPGMQAIRELGVISPLMDCGWRKDEERQLLCAWGHEVWDMPEGACLATRVACGEPLTFEKLDVVRRCEDYLRGLGLKQVRVRLGDECTVVTAAQEDLTWLARLGGMDVGNAEAVTEVPLPSSVLETLNVYGAQNVYPSAKPYRHGGCGEPLG